MAPQDRLDVLILGSGGREHALLKACLRSPRVARVRVAPGNGGMALEAECLDVDAAKIRILNEGGIPIHEPGLASMVARNKAAGRLRFTTDIAEAVAHGTIQFIAVGTPPEEDGAADMQHVLAAARSIGSSVGISLVITYLAQQTQANHAALAGYIDPLRLAVSQAVEAGTVNLSTTQGLMAIDAEVMRQAATLAYLQDFRLMMWIG